MLCCGVPLWFKRSQLTCVCRPCRHSQRGCVCSERSLRRDAATPTPVPAPRHLLRRAAPARAAAVRCRRDVTIWYLACATCSAGCGSGRSPCCRCRPRCNPSRPRGSRRLQRPPAVHSHTSVQNFLKSVCELLLYHRVPCLKKKHCGSVKGRRAHTAHTPRAKQGQRPRAPRPFPVPSWGRLGTANMPKAVVSLDAALLLLHPRPGRLLRLLTVSL